MLKLGDRHVAESVFGLRLKLYACTCRWFFGAVTQRLRCARRPSQVEQTPAARHSRLRPEWLGRGIELELELGGCRDETDDEA